MDAFFKWLTEQSTIKAIIVLCGVAGLQVAPDMLTEIMTAVGVLYAGIAAIFDRS